MLTDFQDFKSFPSEVFSTLIFEQGSMLNVGLLPCLLSGPEDPWVAYAGHDDELRRLPACNWFSPCVIYTARRVELSRKVAKFGGSSGNVELVFS